MEEDKVECAVLSSQGFPAPSILSNSAVGNCDEKLLRLVLYTVEGEYLDLRAKGYTAATAVQHGLIAALQTSLDPQRFTQE